MENSDDKRTSSFALGWAFGLVLSLVALFLMPNEKINANGELSTVLLFGSIALVVTAIGEGIRNVDNDKKIRRGWYFFAWGFFSVFWLLGHWFFMFLAWAAAGGIQRTIKKILKHLNAPQ